MKKIFYQLFVHSVFFGALVFLLTCALAFSAMIPQRYIQKHMEESAEELYKYPNVRQIIPNVNSSKVHPYADMLTLNIGYHFADGQLEETGEKHHGSINMALRSVMWAKYYGNPDNDDIALECFLQSVQDKIPGNTEYLRYWHGSAGIIRVLHVFWNIKQIYVFHSIILLLILFVLLGLLFRNNLKKEAFSLVFSLTMVSIWFVPICLEYYWCFLVMLVASIMAVRIALSKKWQKSVSLFFFTGIIIAFLDFLTAETITLVIPLLLLLVIGKKEDYKDRINPDVVDRCVGWKLVIKSCTAWLAGFCLMWGAKWMLASLILQQDVGQYIRQHVEERIGGEAYGKSLLQYCLGAVGRNIRALLPFDYGEFGYLILGIVIGAGIALIITHTITRRRAVNYQLVKMLFAIGCIPLVRYVVLHNHAWFHRSFTFRALAGTVMALCFISIELFEFAPRKAVPSND